MADIFREVDEDVRRERLAEFGKRYGSWIAAALIAVVLGTACWVGWKNWQQAKRAEQTEKLASALDLVRNDNDKAAIDALSQFERSDAGAAMLARFYAAGLMADNKDVAGAVKAYDELAASDIPPAFRELAALLSVLHQVDTAEPGALIERLKPMTAATSPWRHTARELTAVLMGRQGNKEGARKMLDELAEDSAAPATVRSRARELAAFYAG